MEKLKQFLAELNRDLLKPMTNKVLNFVQEELFRNQPPATDLPDLAELVLDDCEDLLEVMNTAKFPVDEQVLERVIELIEGVLEECEMEG